MDPTSVFGVSAWMTADAAAEQPPATADAEARFRALFDQSPLLIAIFDPDGSTRAVNPALKQTLGLSAAELISYNVLADPRPESQLRSIFRQAAAGETAEVTTVRAASPATGLPVGPSIEVTGFPIHDGHGEVSRIVVIGQDVTARAKAEVQARESEARFRAIFEQAAVGIARVDLQGRFLEVNSRWTAISGHSQEALLAGDFQQITHPDDLDTDIDHMTDLLEGRADSYTMEKRYISPAGETIWVNLAVAVVRDASGAPDYFVSVIEDISGRKSAEAALADSRAQLEAANALLEARIADRTAELQRTNQRLTAEIERREVAQAALIQAQKLEALGQLTSGIAHDFNNVIAAISSGYSVIARRTSDPKVTEIAEHGVKAAERGAAIVKQLLAFARQEVLEPRIVRLSDVLSEAEPLIRHSLIPGVSLRIDCPETLPAVRVDPSQLETALINLAVNARDAMPDGGALVFKVALSPAGAPNRPAELSGVEAVALAVSDTGCGIAPDVLQRVVEPFFTTKGPGKGTGLGLAMVHGFAHQSGGALRIESREGIGTTVTIYFPLAQEHPAEVIDNVTGAAQDAWPRGSATLLVVDDDPGVRAVTTALLRDNGYTAHEADSGAAALDLFRGTPAIKAVISDVVMPELDGPTMMAELRRLRPDLPVLFMTGHADRNLLAGEAVIDKPFSPATLLGAVARLLQSGSSAQPLAPSSKSVNPAGA